MTTFDPATQQRIWRQNLAEAQLLLAYADNPDARMLAEAQITLIRTHLDRAAKAAKAAEDVDDEAQQDAHVAQLRAWQAAGTLVRLDGARTVRVVVDVRACRWPCPRFDDAGQECVAVVDLAEPHDIRWRIAGVHLLPGELTPVIDLEETS